MDWFNKILLLTLYDYVCYTAASIPLSCFCQVLSQKHFHQNKFWVPLWIFVTCRNEFQLLTYTSPLYTYPSLQPLPPSSTHSPPPPCTYCLTLPSSGFGVICIGYCLLGLAGVTVVFGVPFQCGLRLRHHALIFVEVVHE